MMKKHIFCALMLLALAAILLLCVLSGCQNLDYVSIACVSKVVSTNADGTISTITVQWDRSGKTQSFRTATDDFTTEETYTFDPHGNVLSRSSDDQLRELSSYQYDDQGYMLSKSYYSVTDTNHETRRDEYVYDSGHNLLSASYGRNKDVYTYDGNGKLLEKTVYQSSELARRLVYDTAGNMTDEYAYSNGKESRHIQYTYDEAGKLLRSVMRDHMAEDPQQADTCTTYTYDTQGNLLEIAVDAPGYQEKTTWTYDAAGRKLTEDHISDSGQTHQKKWTYDENGLLLRYTYDNTTYEWRYDGKGNLIQCVFSVDGRTVTYDISYQTLRVAGEVAERIRSQQDQVFDRMSFLDCFKLPELP